MGCKTTLVACKGLRGSKPGSGDTGEEGTARVPPERLAVGREGRAEALLSNCDFSVLPEVSAVDMLLLCNQEESKPRKRCFGVFFRRDSQDAISTHP